MFQNEQVRKISNVATLNVQHHLRVFDTRESEVEIICE